MGSSTSAASAQRPSRESRRAWIVRASGSSGWCSQSHADSRPASSRAASVPIRSSLSTVSTRWSGVLVRGWAFSARTHCAGLVDERSSENSSRRRTNSGFSWKHASNLATLRSLVPSNTHGATTGGSRPSSTISGPLGRRSNSTRRWAPTSWSNIPSSPPAAARQRGVSARGFAADPRRARCRRGRAPASRGHARR